MKKSIQVFLAAAAILCSIASVPAQAALAIIVHPSNPLSGITADDVAQIFLGKTGEFPNGKAATPVDQAAGAARDKFIKSVLKKDEDELKGYWAKLLFTGRAQPPREIGDDAAVRTFVSKNPDAIGYVDGKLMDGSVKVLLIIP